MTSEGIITTIEIVWDRVDDTEHYPFSIPAVRSFGRVRMHPSVTFLLGENGTGKSTIVEAVAVALGLNAEGGSRNFRFSSRASHSGLFRSLRIARARPVRDAFFLRAESAYNVASEIERLDEVPATTRPIAASYGGRALHHQSHGESFLAIAANRFGSNGVYLLDEPEAALSPRGQLALLAVIHEKAVAGAQFIIATHSPILSAYPNALIYELGDDGPRQRSYEDTTLLQTYRDFLREPARFLHYAVLSEVDSNSG